MNHFDELISTNKSVTLGHTPVDVLVTVQASVALYEAIIIAEIVSV